jgi:hypothetical protein
MVSGFNNDFASGRSKPYDKIKHLKLLLKKKKVKV